MATKIKFSLSGNVDLLETGGNFALQETTYSFVHRSLTYTNTTQTRSSGMIVMFPFILDMTVNFYNVHSQ